MSNPAHERIRSDIADNDVVLFMKGTPVFPQCGCSAAVVEILSDLGVKFKGVNVLADADVRQGIKEFSNWPTIPQLYVKGEFVGGCDIIREMYEAQELAPFFAERGIALENVRGFFFSAKDAKASARL
jgi:monothiol glutaredoxin